MIMMITIMVRNQMTTKKVRTWVCMGLKDAWKDRDACEGCVLQTDDGDVAPRGCAYAQYNPRPNKIFPEHMEHMTYTVTWIEEG